MRRNQMTQTSQNKLLLITSLLLFVIVNQQISQANANVVGSRFSPENLQAAQQAEAERVAKGKIAASRARLTTTNTEKTTDATSVEDVVVDILSDKVEGDGATPVKPQTIQRGTTLVDIAKRRNRQQLEKKASESQKEKSSGSETNEVKEEKKDEGMPRRFAQSLLNAGRAVDLGKLAVEAPNEEDAKNAREADITAQPTKTASELLDDLAKNLSLSNRKSLRPASQASPVQSKSNRPSVSRQIDSEPSGDQSLLPPLLGQNLPAFRDPEMRGKADHIPIDRLIHRHNRDGSYTFGYESMDGFKLETRLPDGQVVGRYGYYDATGQLKVIEYGADKDLGFVPKGDGIQVPPTVLRAESGNEISDQASGENQDPFLSVDFSGRDEPPPQRRPTESTPLPSPAFPAFQGFPQQQPFLQVLPGGFLQPQPAPGFGAPAGGERPTFLFGQDGRLTSSGAEQQSGPTGFFAGPPQQQQQAFIPGFFNQPVQPVTNFQPRPLPPSASSQPNTQENSPQQEQLQPNPQQESTNPQTQQPSGQPPQQPPQDNRFFFLPQQQATNLNSNPALVDPLFNQPIFQGFPPAFPGFNQPQQLIRPQNEQPRPTPSIFPGFQQPQQQRPAFAFFPPNQPNNNQFINRPPPSFAGFGTAFRGEERQPGSFLAPFQRPGQPTSVQQQLESPGFFVRQQRERQFDNGFTSNPFFR